MDNKDKKSIDLSIVVSVYNEEAVINEFHKEIESVLDSIDCQYEVLYINDGSEDASEGMLNMIAETRDYVKLVHFSRNFGHEAAMIAGIDYARGNFIICMDADLQHPPTCIPDMYQAYLDGDQIVLMARQENKDAGLFKNITSSMFYSVMNWLGNDKFVKNVSDFFGMARPVADLFRTEYREKRRYLRGYIQHVGFQKKVINYVAAPRLAGKSKYNIKRLIEVFVIAIVNFSKNLVRTGFAFSGIAFAFSIAFLVYTIVTFVLHHTWSGVGILSSVISFFFSLQFILMGIMGEYIGAILSETNRRPIYIVKEKCHLDE